MNSTNVLISIACIVIIIAGILWIASII